MSFGSQIDLMKTIYQYLITLSWLAIFVCAEFIGNGERFSNLYGFIGGIYLALVFYVVQLFIKKIL